MSRRHDELAGAADELRAAQESLAALQAQVDAEQGERERFHTTTEHALAQLAEVRAALREHQSSISVQLPSERRRARGARPPAWPSCAARSPPPSAKAPRPRPPPSEGARAPSGRR